MYHPKECMVCVSENGVACEWDVSIETTILLIVLMDVKCWNGKDEHAAARMYSYRKRSDVLN
jgi:hypothetical protein